MEKVDTTQLPAVLHALSPQARQWSPCPVFPALLDVLPSRRLSRHSS